MPQPPDPYALHEATLAKLRQEQSAAEKPPAPPENARSARSRAENREVAPEGATNIFGSATGAIYDLGALVLTIGLSVIKWTLVLGTKLVVAMSRAARWSMNVITGDD